MPTSIDRKKLSKAKEGGAKSDDHWPGQVGVSLSQQKPSLVASPAVLRNATMICSLADRSAVTRLFHRTPVAMTFLF